MSIELSAIEGLALSKAFKADRDAVAPGTYEIDMLVRVHGSMTVAQDTEKTSTVSIPVKEVLALFVARSGATREASLKLLEECLTDALVKSSTGCGAISEMADIDQVFSAQMTKLIASLPKTPVRGAVRTKLQVEASLRAAEEVAA